MATRVTVKDLQETIRTIGTDFGRLEALVEMQAETIQNQGALIKQLQQRIDKASQWSVKARDRITTLTQAVFN